jgi:transcriptional regulator with XRE-family HTH domain
MKKGRKLVINGLRVYQLRVEAGLTLEQAARKAEMGALALAKIEWIGRTCELQERHTSHEERQALRLAAALGVSIDALAQPATVEHDGRERLSDAGLFSEEDLAIADRMWDKFVELGYIPDPNKYNRLSDAPKRRKNRRGKRRIAKDKRP